MTTPLPPPGWYPDPGGTDSQRYFDGTEWTDHVAPSNPPSGAGPTKSRRPFVMMAIGGPIVAIVSFVLMQLAFSAASGGGSGKLWLQIVGFVLFLIWLAGVVTALVGLIGAIVRNVRRRQNG